MWILNSNGKPGYQGYLTPKGIRESKIPLQQKRFTYKILQKPSFPLILSRPFSFLTPLPTNAVNEVLLEPITSHR